MARTNGWISYDVTCMYIHTYTTIYKRIYIYTYMYISHVHIRGSGTEDTATGQR
jgi:hypothetical protein